MSEQFDNCIYESVLPLQSGLCVPPELPYVSVPTLTVQTQITENTHGTFRDYIQIQRQERQGPPVLTKEPKSESQIVFSDKSAFSVFDTRSETPFPLYKHHRG